MKPEKRMTHRLMPAGDTAQTAEIFRAVLATDGSGAPQWLADSTEQLAETVHRDPDGKSPDASNRE
jgi:hypothetical protein